MGCFKQVWLSFYRQNRGFGMIETALLLPIFLMFAFAVIDFGNYMIVKNRIVSANQAIASAIQNNPTMSETEFNTIVLNLLGDFLIKNGKLLKGTAAMAWTSKTPPSISTAPFWSKKADFTSPWLSDV